MAFLHGLFQGFRERPFEIESPEYGLYLVCLLAGYVTMEKLLDLFEPDAFM